jgi:hypothetical protein
MSTFGGITKDLLTLAGVAAADLDSAAFTAADDDAPFVLGLYLPASTETISIAELIERCERSVLGRVYRNVAGLWTCAIWTPIVDRSTLRHFYEGDISNFVPDPQVAESVAGNVRVNYAYHQAHGTFLQATASDPDVLYGRQNSRTLTIPTLLTVADDAAVMASRFASLARGYQRVRMTLTPGAMTFEPWTKALFTRSRGPSPSGAYAAELLEVEVFEKELSGGTVAVTLTDVHGLRDLGRVSAADAIPDWDSASADERLQYGFSQDDTYERVDAADATTYHRGGVAW